MTTMQVQQPKQVAPESFGRRVATALTEFIHRFRFVLWGVLGAAIVFLVGYFGWSEITRRQSVTTTRQVEQAETLYDSWLAETDTAKKAELQKDLLSRLDGLAKRPGWLYGTQRALMLRADLRAELAAWDEAAADYRELARRFPGSYLAPIALFNAATCLEEKSDREGAVKLYTDIVTRWKETAVAPRALFALGRLAEDAGTWDEAKSRYEQLDAEWSTSSWTQLAKNRLVALKVAGKIQ
jgi:tetratricopeptide (TPR) repeat protein